MSVTSGGPSNRPTTSAVRTVQPTIKKVPDRLEDVLWQYGKLGSWKEVATYYGCSVSTIKNAMGPFIAGHGYKSVGHAIFQTFVSRAYLNGDLGIALRE